MAWEHIRSTYDTVARAYEARFLDELDAKPHDRELLTAFAKGVRDPVVEIGCGPGQIGFFVRRCGRRVYGIDLSPEMAARANGHLDGATVADMRSLPLASDRIAGLVAFYSVIHVQRPELGSVLREFYRVLQPGGRVLFSAHEGQGQIERDTFLDEPVPVVATLFELDELVEAGENAGLVVTRSERRMPYPSENEMVRLYVEASKPAPGLTDPGQE
jgi:SAM-dependent methyltransferase